MEDILIGAGIGVFVGFIASFFIKEAYLTRKISRLEEENVDLDESLKALKQKEWSAQGYTAKREKSERQSAMMLEFAQAMQSGAKIEDVIKTIGAKYPDIAMDLVKKGLKI